MKSLILIFSLWTTLHGGISNSDGGIGVIGVRVEHRFFGKDRISKVFPGSPAEKAGLKAGDIIEYVDAWEWGSITGPVGKSMSIIIERGDDEIEYIMDRVDSRTITDPDYHLGKY